MYNLFFFFFLINLEILNPKPFSKIINVTCMACCCATNYFFFLLTNAAYASNDSFYCNEQNNTL